MECRYLSPLSSQNKIKLSYRPALTEGEEQEREAIRNRISYLGRKLLVMEKRPNHGNSTLRKKYLDEIAELREIQKNFS